jgi:hypothetical protein
MTEHSYPTFEVLTADELATMLKVSRKFVEEHTTKGDIPGQFKVGRVWRYHKNIIQKSILKGGQFLLYTEAKRKSQ